MPRTPVRRTAGARGSRETATEQVEEFNYCVFKKNIHVRMDQKTLLCAKCYTDMTAKRNGITGQVFMGCPKWPDCHQRNTSWAVSRRFAIATSIRTLVEEVWLEAAQKDTGSASSSRTKAANPRVVTASNGAASKRWIPADVILPG